MCLRGATSSTIMAAISFPSGTSSSSSFYAPTQVHFGTGWRHGTLDMIAEALTVYTVYPVPPPTSHLPPPAPFTFPTPAPLKPFAPEQNRGYAQPKIQENVEAEIMQVLLEEARDSYEENIILVRRKWHLFSFPRSQD